MDFKRVEGIFLVVFLFLNMFLFYVYQEGKTEQKTVSTGTISENIEERLRADDIKVPHSLSEKIHQGYYLSAEEGQFFQDAKEQLKNQEWQVNDAQLTSQLFSKTDTVIDSENGEKEVEAFITKKGNVLYSDEYKYSTFESQKDTKYMFHQEWEGLPVYDETSQLSVNLQKDNAEVATIDSYEQTYITNIEALRDPQKLISEREAIISLYTNNRLQSGNKIKWIELGYTRIFTVREKNVYIPAWFVAVESNKNNIQIEKVNAFSSAIISSNVSEVKN
ncbi:two-component system regulatory protein YycI [Vagococcus fluvialis]|uniref:two-component system regulatory protein YycI n=1 Tax=Vagococcus fluvialis TaxID=2738 RepID=UPI003B5BC783